MSSAITVSFVLPLFPLPPFPVPFFRSRFRSLNGFRASDEYKEPQIHCYSKMFGRRDVVTDRSLIVTLQRCHNIRFSLHFEVQKAPKHRLTQHKLGSVANGRRARSEEGRGGEGMKEEGGTEFCFPKDDSHAVGRGILRIGKILVILPF